MSTESTMVLLTAATWTHLGFQVTVSSLVYPVLAVTPAEGWAAAHDRHSRVIAPVVVVVYVALLVGTALALTRGVEAPLLVAAAGVALSLGTTALVAAPLHGRLGAHGPSPQRLALLLRADRVRTVGAVVAAAGATLAWS